MAKNILINVETENLSDLKKDGNILLYDKKVDRYYVTTRQALLGPQDKKIEDLENQIKEFVKLSEQQRQNFEEITTERIEAFLKQQQETNQIIIDMVKSIVNNNN